MYHGCILWQLDWKLRQNGLVHKSMKHTSELPKKKSNLVHVEGEPAYGNELEWGDL